MTKKVYFYAIAASLLVSGISSCVDKRYDIDDVDLGVQLAPEGITVPLAVIETKTLGDLLKDYDKVSEEDGYYAVVAESSESKSLDGAVVEAAATLAQGGGFGDMGWEEHFEDIDFSDITAGLEDIGGATLDIVAPHILLSFVNPAPVTLEITLDFTPKDESGALLEDQRIDMPSIGIAPAVGGVPATTNIFIAEEGVQTPAGYTVIHPDNFENFLKTLPSLIEGSYKVGVKDGDPSSVDPTATYEFGMSYKAVFPLAFGPDFSITASTSEDMGDAFSDISDMGLEVSQISIGAELETSFPLLIEGITIDLLDGNDVPVSGVDATVSGGVEGPSPSAAGSTMSTLSVSLDVAGGDLDALSAIEQMELHLPLKGTAGAGEVIRFKSSDYVKGRVWVSIPGGVDVDVEQLMD